MAITTVSAQLIQFKSAEEQVVVNIKTNAPSVALERGSNAKYSTSIKDVNALADALGSLAFSNGIPAVTTSANGLMIASDKAKLDGIAEGANKYIHPGYSARNAGFYKVTVDATGHVSNVAAVQKADITSLGIPGQDTTYGVFKAATASAAGGTGLVPAPEMGKQAMYLRGDGTWATPTNTTYGNATGSTAGLMSPGDKTKLDGIATGANKYIHPNSGVQAGTYRSVTVDAMGHVTAGTNPTTLAGYGITDAAAKSHQHGNADITALDASKLTGTISIDRLPHGALERCVPVKSDSERFALTSAQVQKGDTVKVTDTGKMYFVVDETKLNTEEGYEVYTAGSATSVPWAGVTGKPTTFTPSAHTQAISTITGLESALNGKAANTDMTGASGSAAGTHGLVPAPSAGANTRYLRSDGTWVTPPNTTYSPVTTTANGLMIASDKAKLDGIAAGANKYVHPTYTAQAAGFYKVTVDASGHISAVAKVQKADITALGIPGQDTTYSAFRGTDGSTAGGAGLVPAPQTGNKAMFLRGDGTWATPVDTKYSVFGKATASAGGSNGLVPAPAAGAQNLYLRGDGTWATPTNTTYGPVTTTANGLMIASDKAKLDGIAAGANKYVHPTGNGNNHLPANGAAGQVLGYSAPGTAAWQDLFFISPNTPSGACMWLKTV